MNAWEAGSLGHDVPFSENPPCKTKHMPAIALHTYGHMHVHAYARAGAASAAKRGTRGALLPLATPGSEVMSDHIFLAACVLAQLLAEAAILVRLIR